jgi:hypothetical protein
MLSSSDWNGSAILALVAAACLPILFSGSGGGWSFLDYAALGVLSAVLQNRAFGITAQDVWLMGE